MASAPKLLILMILGFSSWAQALPHLVVPEFAEDYPLAGSYGLILDPKQQLTLEEIAGNLDRFVIQRQQAQNLGLFAGSVWLAFHFDYQGQTAREYFLDLGNPLYSSADFYVFDESMQLQKTQKSGLEIPFKDLPIRSVKTMIPLNFKGPSEQIVLVRLRCSFTLGISPALLTPKYYYEEWARKHDLALGIYVGIIGGLFFYNFFLFQRLRERVYLWFSINLIVCYLILITSPLGFPLRYLLPESGDLGIRLLMACFGLTIVSTLMFSCDFLNLKQHAPGFYRIAMIMAGSGLLVMLASTVSSVQTIFLIANAITGVGLIFVISSALHLSLRKNQDASIFLMAWSPMFLGVSVLLLGFFGVIRLGLQQAAITVLMLSAMQTLAFTMALTTRLSLRKRELQRLHLEKQQAEQERHTLTAELLAGKAVQEAIQWPVDSMPSFRFSHHYRSAENIGGDWLGCAYDASHRRSLLFICDVNGHGITAGMLSGTVSGAVGGCLAQTFGQNLSREQQLLALMHAVNYVLLEWGHKTDKVATMAILAIDGETGEATIMNAGHTHVYLIRQGTGKGLPARGSILGLHKDPKFRSYDFKLKAGDTLFLYSDGLFENHNEKGEVVGIRPVLELFKESSDPDRLKDRLLALVQKTWGQEKLDDDFCFAFAQYAPEEPLRSVDPKQEQTA